MLEYNSEHHAIRPLSRNHQKYNNIRKQKAMKLPKMIPSLRRFELILPIRLLMPGIWLAAPVILLLMLAKVSRWNPKFSFTAYAWLRTLSAILWLLSMRLRSSSMYSASAADGFDALYASMSERTLERRFALLRASVRDDFRRDSSRRWSCKISRWRARLFCLTADMVGSESRRRVSWFIRSSL
jgi:hypothetical protein